MKKVLLISGLLTFCSAAVFAATYKVNTNGKVVSPSGQVQQSSSVLTPAEVYSNYYSDRYVSNKQVLEGAVGTIDIIMDYSGSMAYWITVAQRAMTAIVAQLPASTKVGLRVFGNDNGNNPYTPVLNKVKSINQDKDGKYKVNTSKASYLGSTSGACTATSQIVPVSLFNPTGLLNAMNSVKIGGSTPLTLALEQAVQYDFKGMEQNFQKKIILITDGGENCGGDPCAFARNLVAQRKDITIDVVLVSSNSKSLVCLANSTGGTFYTTADTESFTNILIDSMQNTQKSTQPQQIPSQQYEFIDN